MINTIYFQAILRVFVFNIKDIVRSCDYLIFIIV